MNNIEINNLLATMRGLAAEAGTSAAEPKAADAPDFGDLLRATIDKVNDNQQAAGGMAASFEAGDPGVDITEVMVALQKADISFKAMTEVRNRLVSAYQEIMNMPV